jgi:hypothetical protein
MALYTKESLDNLRHIDLVEVMSPYVDFKDPARTIRQSVPSMMKKPALL